jgi:hypothetical protein
MLDVTEIEVTEPTHPLKGKRFPIIYISNSRTGASHVYVSYKKHMILKIEISSTNLTTQVPIIRTKLTQESLEEFLKLAQECEVLCQSNQQKSGKNYQKKPKTK